MGFSATFQALCERAIFGRTNPITSVPSTIYAAGFIGSSEETASGYARVAVTNDTTSFPAATPLVNGIAIDFPFSSAGYGAWTSIRFYDASSGGSEVGRSATFTAIASGANIVHIPAGTITVSIT